MNAGQFARDNAWPAELGYAAGQMSARDWHTLLGRFDDATIEQTMPYAAARVATRRLEHFVVRRLDEPVLAAQIVVLEAAWACTGVCVVKFGPLWRPHGQAQDPETLAAALGLLREEYARRRRLSLRVMPAAWAEDSGVLAQAFERAGYAGQAAPSPARYVVNLAHPIDELRSALKPKWRSHLRKAENNELQVRVETRAQAVDAFFALYRDMSGRKQFADSSSIHQLRSYSAELPPSLSPAWVLCYHGTQPVAGAVVSSMGDTAQYLFGASSRRGLELRAGYVVQWAVVQWLKEQGRTWYDLGGDCDDAGLRQFKSGLVGRAGVVCDLPGSFDAHGSVYSRMATALLFRARDLRAAVSVSMSATLAWAGRRQ